MCHVAHVGALCLGLTCVTSIFCICICIVSAGYGSVYEGVLQCGGREGALTKSMRCVHSICCWQKPVAPCNL